MEYFQFLCVFSSPAAIEEAEVLAIRKAMELSAASPLAHQVNWIF
jgi:hypothetical protein